MALLQWLVMSKTDKTPLKRLAFLERTRKIVPKFRIEQLRNRRQSVRVNTLRSDQIFPNPIPWAAHCYWLGGDKSDISRSDDAEQGRVYLQNAASFIPPLVLNPHPNDRILDMCAAPGGKASHIAAITGNKAELWANDNSRARLNRMITNFQRLGVKAHNTTLFAIDSLRRELPHEYFDKILLDAPCSGEGMIDLDDPKSLSHWSLAHIKRLQRVQKKAITTAWDLLRPGGLLVYSTCTMAPEENEAVVDYLLRKHPAAHIMPINLEPPNRIPLIKSWNNRAYQTDLTGCLRLGPSTDIEAFFVAAIRKPT